MKAFGFVAILAGVVALTACEVKSGDTDGEGGEGGAGSTTTTSATTGQGGGATTGQGGGGGGTGGGGECADATADECGDCCNEALPDAQAALVLHAISQCGCAADSPCASECDTTDATTDACNDDGTVNDQANNTACVTCLAGLAEDAACVDAAATDCEEDAACNPYFECLSSCQ
ncbi:hypothetical protein [Sorangium sp. So ce1000]|uniref:hypothetical protein n=1 Tax=Sorangium sp. So ce1000 TaxID=3133325 RepID=UPI003F63FBC0